MSARRGWSDRARAKAEQTRRARQLAAERPVLDALRALRAEGCSWRAIAARLEEGPFDPPGRRGRWTPGCRPGPWTHKSVLRIARRHGLAAQAPDPAPAQISTPHSGPPESGAPGAGHTLADLAPGEALCARCPRCGHAGALDLDRLAPRLGEHVALEEIRRRLRCTACGLRDVLLHRQREDPTRE